MAEDFDSPQEKSETPSRPIVPGGQSPDEDVVGFWHHFIGRGGVLGNWHKVLQLVLLMFSTALLLAVLYTISRGLSFAIHDPIGWLGIGTSGATAVGVGVSSAWRRRRRNSRKHSLTADRRNRRSDVRNARPPKKRAKADKKVTPAGGGGARKAGNRGRGPGGGDATAASKQGKKKKGQGKKKPRKSR
jgi:hypothetical protein